MTPRSQGAATRMTIYVGGGDLWHNKPLFSEISHRAHDRGLAGASVLHGIEGFGSSSFVYTGRLPTERTIFPPW